MSATLSVDSSVVFVIVNSHRKLIWNVTLSVYTGLRCNLLEILNSVMHDRLLYSPAGNSNLVLSKQNSWVLFWPGDLCSFISLLTRFLYPFLRHFQFSVSVTLYPSIPDSFPWSVVIVCEDERNEKSALPLILSGSVSNFFRLLE